MIISLSSKSLRLSETMEAPADLYSSSVMPEPRPADFSMNTLWPSLTRALTPPGTRPTRCSRFLISLGTPIFMRFSPLAVEAQIVREALRVLPRRQARKLSHDLARRVADEKMGHAVDAQGPVRVQDGVGAEGGRVGAHGLLAVEAHDDARGDVPLGQVIAQLQDGGRGAAAIVAPGRHVDGQADLRRAAGERDGRGGQGGQRLGRKAGLLARAGGQQEHEGGPEALHRPILDNNIRMITPRRLGRPVPLSFMADV